jgi:hypothetical protein
MLQPDYYKLKKAAEILECSEDDVIYFGACGKLPIHVLTSNFNIIDSTGKVVEKGPKFNDHLKLAACCIKKFEAGDKKARVIIEPQPYSEEMGDDGCAQNGEFQFELEPINEDEDKEVINLCRPPPVLLQDCVMVVMADDLERLKQQTPQDEVIKDDDKAEVKLTKNDKRNQIAKNWLETEAKAHDLSTMRNPEIVNKLEEFSRTLKDENGKAIYKKGLFAKGGMDWLSRDHSVIPKGNPGRKPSK